jgi:thiamine biosynthesis protein ThiS
MTATPAAESRLTLRVNGETRDVPTGWTIQTLLDDLHLDPRLVVVERNREILRDRTALPAVRLQDGDVLELVHFVGGG